MTIVTRTKILKTFNSTDEGYYYSAPLRRSFSSGFIVITPFVYLLWWIGVHYVNGSTKSL